MRNRSGMLVMGGVAFAIVVGAGAFTTSQRLGADGCPLDRDVMVGGPAHAANDPGTNASARPPRSSHETSGTTR